MYDSILIPTDGSKTVENTLTHAIPLAKDNDATIHALYVLDRRIVQASSEELRTDVSSDLREQGEAALATVKDRAKAAGVESESAIVEGTPDKAIVRYADEHGIDVIVIGTHGKTPREKLESLGSVSDRVVDNAPVPVFVIK